MEVKEERRSKGLLEADSVPTTFPGEVFSVHAKVDMEGERKMKEAVEAGKTFNGVLEVNSVHNTWFREEAIQMGRKAEEERVRKKEEVRRVAEKEEREEEEEGTRKGVLEASGTPVTHPGASKFEWGSADSMPHTEAWNAGGWYFSGGSKAAPSPFEATPSLLEVRAADSFGAFGAISFEAPAAGLFGAFGAPAASSFGAFGAPCTPAASFGAFGAPAAASSVPWTPEYEAWIDEQVQPGACHI